MKLEDIKETISGLNDLGCLVELQVVNDKVYFVDDTRWIHTEVKTQDKLNEVLRNNTFAGAEV